MMDRACSTIGENGNLYGTSVGKPEGKITARKTGAWVDNIKMGLGEIGWDDVDCIDAAQNRDQWRALVNTLMTLEFHKILECSLVAAQLAVSGEGLSCEELVS
jgi:hypothetical protein